MSSDPAPIFVVSKPLAPPWTDGSKNLARELVDGLAVTSPSRSIHAFVPKGRAGATRARGHEVSRARLDPAIALEMLGALVVDRSSSIHHFLFAPSARSARVGRALVRLRGRASVQTVASVPARGVRLGDVVFADRVTVLSRASHERALDEGVPAARLSLIPVAIRPPLVPPPSLVSALRAEHRLEGRFVVTFPGDLEHGDGAPALLDAIGAMHARRDVTLVLACRDKTPRARDVRSALASRARRAGVDVRTIGETPHILGLLRASDVVAMPTRSLYAKVDHPLVLLEAMHLGVPVLVSSGSSASELADDGALSTDFAPDAIATALDALVADRARLAAAGESARAGVSRRTVEAMARAYEAVYEGLEA